MERKYCRRKEEQERSESVSNKKGKRWKRIEEKIRKGQRNGEGSV